MAGIISSKKPSTDNLSPRALQSRMAVPPKMRNQFQRIVVAGMKVMFDPSTQKLRQQAMQGNGPLPQKLGLSIAGVMGLLLQESRNSLPPQLIIPCGIVLLAHARDYLLKGRQELSDADFGTAVGVFIDAVLGQAKIDSNKIIANIEARGKKAQEVTPLVKDEQAGAEPPAPTEEEPPAEAPPAEEEAAPVEGEEEVPA
jgi:hypothetical protein